jgi:hypothetical protein
MEDPKIGAAKKANRVATASRPKAVAPSHTQAAKAASNVAHDSFHAATSTQWKPYGPFLSSISKPASFEYQSRHPRDLTKAQSWSPEKGGLSGTIANRLINNDYHALNQDMQRYLSGDAKKSALPKVADWMTFGKYASREAGQQLASLEKLTELKQLNPEAASHLLRNCTTPAQILQAASMGAAAIRDNTSTSDLVNIGANPISTIAKLGLTGSLELNERLGKLQHALVKGNTEIHRNIAPAYDVFMNGEANGGKGMEALQQAGYNKGSEKDPQGYVTQAFSCYQDARKLGLQAQEAQDPAVRQRLLDQRQHAVERANLFLGLQEQKEILQDKEIFGQPDVQKALGAISGQMTLTDATGTHSVGSADKNWTDLQGRLGLKEVAASAETFPMTDSNGTVHHYAVDNSQHGTIAEYFANNTTGRNAETLINCKPRPVDFAPTSKVGSVINAPFQMLQMLRDQVVETPYFDFVQ